MAVFNMFSKRQRRANQEPDIFPYAIPHELRIQLLRALDDARERIYDRTIPSYRILGTEGDDIFAKACTVLRRKLAWGGWSMSANEFAQWPTQKPEACAMSLPFSSRIVNPNRSYDSVEIVMHFIKQAEQNGLLDDECNARTVADEINTRFLEHRVGFQYEAGQIIVQSNKVLHDDAVKPALLLLADPAFEGANEEYSRLTNITGMDVAQSVLSSALKHSRVP